MLKSTEKEELCQISLTGLRALVILGLLIIQPHSFEEIKETLIKLGIFDYGNSDDIIRIDLNTLKYMGCDISRPLKKDNYKYILRNHPFKLELSEDEINALSKIYKRVAQKNDLSLLIKFDKFILKLLDYVKSDDMKEKLKGISILKYYDFNLIKVLSAACFAKNSIEFVYTKASSVGFSERKENIIAQELYIKNNKIYLLGYDKDKKKSLVFNLLRIKSLLLKGIQDNQIETKLITIRFKLKKSGIEPLEENEQIIEQYEDYLLIEGKYIDEFNATQRVLSFGANCTVIEPAEFKQTIIRKLIEMRKIYEE